MPHAPFALPRGRPLPPPRTTRCAPRPPAATSAFVRGDEGGQVERGPRPGPRPAPPPPPTGAAAPPPPSPPLPPPAVARDVRSRAEAEPEAPGPRPAEERPKGVLGRFRGFVALPLAIFHPYEGLPPDGRTRTKADERCNPMEQRCQTPMHVWEAACSACGGLGAARPRTRSAAYRGGRGRGRGRGTPHGAYHTCALCAGVGYVRHTSSRVWPDLRGGASSSSSSAAAAAASATLTAATAPGLTLGRPPRGPGDESSDEDEWESYDSDEEEDGDSSASS